MHHKTQKAFTMIELIFVIVIIGILSAVAIPKFQKSAVLAHDTKATSVLTSVMSAIATERQKRILMGDTGNITSLGAGGYAFSLFNKDKYDKQREVLNLPISNCKTGDKGCWTRDGITYKYTFIDTGTADFKLQNNKLVCDNDSTDCTRLLH